LQFINKIKKKLTLKRLTFKVVYFFKILRHNKVTKTKREREIVLNNDFVNNVYVIIYTFDKNKDFSIYRFFISKNNIV